ncbi:MAG: Txe/YoeB family addiction module toxin [Cyanobacteria bacterium P01_A01_bin.116]|mgnify:CR=1 FL=1
MKNITFTPEAFDQFNSWAKQDKKVYRKLITLINDTIRQPFTGLGKPEALKHSLKGYWSRRITDEHRLVYRVTETEIMITSCRFHY